MWSPTQHAVERYLDRVVGPGAMSFSAACADLLRCAKESHDTGERTKQGEAIYRCPTCYIVAKTDRKSGRRIIVTVYLELNARHLRTDTPPTEEEQQAEVRELIGELALAALDAHGYQVVRREP